MTVITTTIHVASNGSISVSDRLPAGDHIATITVAQTPLRPDKPFTMQDFPIHDQPWDDSISLRREDLYDGQGRLR